MKITDKMRLDFAGQNIWRISYDEIGHGRFAWRCHSLERTSKSSRDIRKAIDAAIHAEAKGRKA